MFTLYNTKILYVVMWVERLNLIISVWEERFRCSVVGMSYHESCKHMFGTKKKKKMYSLYKRQ